MQVPAESMQLTRSPGAGPDPAPSLPIPMTTQSQAPTGLPSMSVQMGEESTLTASGAHRATLDLFNALTEIVATSNGIEFKYKVIYLIFAAIIALSFYIGFLWVNLSQPFVNSSPATINETIVCC